MMFSPESQDTVDALLARERSTVTLEELKRLPGDVLCAYVNQTVSRFPDDLQHKIWGKAGTIGECKHEVAILVQPGEMLGPTWNGIVGFLAVREAADCHHWTEYLREEVAVHCPKESLERLLNLPAAPSLSPPYL